MATLSVKNVADVEVTNQRLLATSSSNQLLSSFKAHLPITLSVSFTADHSHVLSLHSGRYVFSTPRERARIETSLRPGQIKPATLSYH